MKQHQRSRRSLSRLGGIFIGLLLVWGTGLGPSSAETGSKPGEEAQRAEEPDPGGTLSVPSGPGLKRAPQGGGPGLDALLKLPSGYGKPTQRPVAGAGEAEWRRRFADARAKLSDANEALANTKRELDSIAGSSGSGQWSVAPPGIGGGAGGPGGSANSPISFKLRQDLQRNREEIEIADKALRELRIEADLAGVPASWRVGESGTEASELN